LKQQFVCESFGDDRRNDFLCARKPRMVLQPKWRKLVALKGEEKQPGDTIKAEDKTKAAVVVPDGRLKNTPDAHAPPEPKKRKRTEEEIAQRKAKKIKKKGKETQEWNQLSEDHQKQLAAEQAKEEGEEATPPQVSSESTNGAQSKPDGALLSTKAKEIAKAQREERLQERQKRPKATRTENADPGKSVEKANQVLQYLDEYHEHVNSGAEWKFRKQHQNWIVKHLYIYSWKSDDLVIGYLKTVQGKARQRLIDEAEKIVRDNGEDETRHDQDAFRRAEGIIRALSE